MFKNYFKIAWRNLVKRKAYTLINILGLATGMAACLLIVLFLQSELGYDSFEKNADHIYRVALERRYPGRSTMYAIIPSSIGQAVQIENPEVKECTRLFDFTNNGSFLLRINNRTFEESHVLAADSNFFRVFSCTMLAGDTATALMPHNSVVINETTAKKYFGSVANAVNKQFQVDGGNNGNNNFLITGVCKDWPENSHFTFNMLISTTGFAFLQEKNYTGFSAYTYLLLNSNASATALEAKLPNIIKKYVAGDIATNFGESFEQFQKAGNGYRYFLQPLKNIHLNSNLEAELGANGSITAIYIFSVVAVFILLLACINFINLSTARSVERAKEVGIRKTFGSERRSLVWQFLMESIMLSLISIALAFLLVVLMLPLFNQLTGKLLTLVYFADVTKIIFLLLFAILVGVIAGLYPALVLSSFKPILVLKGRFKSSRFGLLLRNGLVIFQFAISVVLIIATVLINKQMNFMLGSQLGFKKDHIITIQRADLLDKQTKAFKNELLALHGVEMVSSNSSMPGGQGFFGVSFLPESSKESVTGRGLFTDDKYASLLNLELKEGRYFSKDFGTDSLAVVINEKAVYELNLKNPLGARITSPENFYNAPDGTPYLYTVVGVVKNFHFQTMEQQVAPLFITNTSRFNDVSGLLAVRVKSANFNTTIASIENTWKKFVPQNPFHYAFLDQTVADQYHTEETARKVFTTFSLLAIFIACIGLLGLAAFTTQQRTREISIRKVLGASIGSIIAMLSKDFLRLVLIASLIAFPLAWLGLHKWLQSFAYRVNMSWWVFIAAALLATLIALLTISFQAIKAALANPVEALRAE